MTDVANMVEKSDTFEVATVLGEKLTTALKGTVNWKEFASIASLNEAGEYPNDSEILEYQNDKRYRSALSSARATLIEDEVKRIKDTPAYKREQFILGGVAAGKTRAEMETVADTLGI